MLDYFLFFFKKYVRLLLYLYSDQFCYCVWLVWLAWTLISCCWIWQSIHHILYTMHLCTLALQFNNNIETNTARKRFVYFSITIQFNIFIVLYYWC